MSEFFQGLITLIGIIVVFALILGLPTMWLWNSVMPEIFELPRISFRQAVCIVVLARILFSPTIKES